MKHGVGGDGERAPAQGRVRLLGVAVCALALAGCASGDKGSQEEEAVNTALLIIDVQTSVVDEGVWEAGQVIERLNGLAAAARSGGVPVVYVRDTGVGPDGSLHPGIRKQPGDLEVEKDHSNSFRDTPLADLLKERNVGRLVIGGMQSDYCVDATCRGAVELGYEVVLVSDAHSTIDGETGTAQEVIARENRDLGELRNDRGKVRLATASEISF